MVRIESTTEDHFTSPSKWCPHPEWWHSYDEQATELEVITGLSGLIAIIQPQVVVETGTHVGLATLAMATVLKQQVSPGVLHTWEVSAPFCMNAKNRCAEVADVIRFHNAPSETASLPEGTEIDFMWCDGKPQRHEDFLHFFQWMRPGTIVGFHDTAPHQGKIPESVEELQAMGLIDCVTFRTPRGLTIAEVLGE